MGSVLSSTYWPCCGFALLLCAMKPLSLRFRLGFILGFLVPFFLSGGLGAIEALILSSCLLVLVSLVVFVSFFLVGLSHHTS